MKEAELRDLLRKASGVDQPSDEFVDSLWSKLDPEAEKISEALERRPLVGLAADEVNHTRSSWPCREPDRMRSGPIVALAVAATVLLVGFLAALLASIGEPEQIASAPASIEPTVEAPVPAGDPSVEEGPSPLVKKCDRLLVEPRVAAVLRPGVVAEATSYRPSGSAATDVSPIELRSLVRVIEQLSDEVRHDVRVHHALSSATGALDQAILFIEMGEPTLAHDSIHEAKATLGELASEPALAGCLQTVS